MAFGLKETPEQVFSCEFYKIFKNIWENLWTTSSVFQFPWKFLTRQVDYMLANCVEFTLTSGLKRKLPPGGVFGKSCNKNFQAFTWKHCQESSHQRCPKKKKFFLNFATSTGTHLSWSLFLIKTQAWKTVTFFNTYFWKTFANGRFWGSCS